MNHAPRTWGANHQPKALGVRREINDVLRRRQRLLRHGPDALADEDLVALVVGTAGACGLPIQRIATALLCGSGGVGGLSRATPRELAQTTGIGLVAATRIAAAFELGRRALDAVHDRRSVGRPEDVYQLVAPRLAGLMQEVFLVIGVDIRNGLLDVVEVARGTVAGVEVHPREVFRPLVRMAAAGGVLVHNHPSGEPTPSIDDVELTRRLREVGAIVGIPIIDHVVVGDRSFRSIAEYVGGL
jgi:DNA repair protein RadC